MAALFLILHVDKTTPAMIVNENPDKGLKS